VTRVVRETVTGEGEPVVVTRVVHEQQEVVATATPIPEPGSKIFVAPDPSRLVITGADDPTTLDPALAYDGLSMAVLHDLLESLIAYDPLDLTRFVPALATHWSRATWPTRSGVGCC
jgi:peptide/nickel transport system substrate-binding protein